MMEQLRKLVEERPDEKVCNSSSFADLYLKTSTQTLIVSQWTGCLSLVSDYLTESGIIHVKYAVFFDAFVSS